MEDRLIDREERFGMSLMNTNTKYSTDFSNSRIHVSCKYVFDPFHYHNLPHIDVVTIDIYF